MVLNSGNAKATDFFAKISEKRRQAGGFLKEFKANWQLYVMIFLPLFYIFMFKYYPMLGAQIAFKDYKITDGIWGSAWVGFKHFNGFVNSPYFWRVIKNTFAISSYSLIFSIPFPIILAIGLEYLKNTYFKKTIQMTLYLPHFLSVVILVGLINLIFDNRTGIVNNILLNLTGGKINFLGDSRYFRSMYVWSGIWQNMGWSSILYVAVLSGVDPQISEAAIVDGANKFRHVWHIDLPGLLPTIAIVTILNMGSLFSVGFDKIFLMQNVTNLKFSEVLSTYEYKTGVGGGLPKYSYAAAIGLVTGVVNFTLVSLTNKISNKISGAGLW